MGGTLASTSFGRIMWAWEEFTPASIVDVAGVVVVVLVVLSASAFPFAELELAFSR